MAVKKLKAKPAEVVEDDIHYCYLCGQDAADNLVGVTHDRLCDYEKAVETGEEHWHDAPICSKCFVKTHGAVFVIRAMKKTS